MTDVDLDSYGEPNDLAPDEPAPREPRGEPTEIHGPYKVWQFDADYSETVPDTFVVAQNPDPLDFRMWVFVGRGREAHFAMRASHRYAMDEAVDHEDCCEVLLEGESLSGDHCPPEVRDLVAELTGAIDVVTPKETDEDRDSPIRY
jgi:hypothetical protein